MRLPRNIIDLVSRIHAAMHAIKIGVALVGALMSADAAAQGAVRDLTRLTLEQLVGMEVSGVSKASERMLDAPASVTIVTAADIRAFGYRDLGELVNGLRGFFTYSDRAYAFAGVRGFAPPGDYNTRVLLLIDGYRANDNIFDQALLGVEGLIDLDVIERVELIRGPGSSVYGSNALLGVINVVTRPASERVSQATLAIGNGGWREIRAQVAGHGSADWPTLHYALHLGYLSVDGFTIDVPQLRGVAPNDGRAAGVDDAERLRAFGTLAFGNWRLNAGGVERRRGYGWGLYGNDFNDARSSLLKETSTFADLRHERAFDAATIATFRAFYGASTYRDINFYDGEPVRYVSSGRWFGGEAQLKRQVSATHRLLAGIEMQHDQRQRQRVEIDVPASVLNLDADGTRTGVYVQSDIEWTSRNSSSLGLRLDRDGRGDEHVSPRLAWIFKPDGVSALKLLAGAAFRAPNVYESSYEDGSFQIANPQLKSERVRTVELAYERILGPGARLAASVYGLRIHDLVTFEVDPAGFGQYVNLGQAKVVGFELESEVRPLSSLRLRAMASYQRAHDADDAELLNAPHWVLRGDAVWQLLPPWTLAAETLYVGARRAEFGTVGGYAVVNLNLSKALAPGWDVALRIRNLFDRRIEDVAVAQLRYAPVDRLPVQDRTVLLTAGYRFR